ncbi:hypothetical protein AB4305_17240 [Nocardia sp. 2YAB30]|uniref:hypothetical protein n=1 Tax=unclassified Nocardia TaxID=2637762 RepID=UPI003F9D1BCF
MTTASRLRTRNHVAIRALAIAQRDRREAGYSLLLSRPGGYTAAVIEFLQRQAGIG